jgi:heat-inducible transcriptional repressor
MELTKRQVTVLQVIVDEYAKTAQPISSSEIIHKHMQDVSSATVRNEMAVLEKHGLLEKTHTSSGRIPSIEGFRYYEKNIISAKVNSDLKNKLSKIFANRDLSIDTVIDQSVEIINETFKLPLVITSESDELLKRFDLIRIDKKNALVIIVTSTGNIVKSTIELKTDKQFDDVAICIRVFNDRLFDTPVSEVTSKLDSIKEIIRHMVHEYEFCMRQIIEKIFDFKKINTKTNISGTKYLTTQPEFQDIKRLNQVLSLLEDTNIWQQISYIQNETGKTSITFGGDIGQHANLAIASTTLNLGGNKRHQISLVGPTRMDYSKVKGVLEFIREEMEKYIK